MKFELPNIFVTANEKSKQIVLPRAEMFSLSLIEYKCEIKITFNISEPLTFVQAGLDDYYFNLWVNFQGKIYLKAEKQSSVNKFSVGDALGTNKTWNL